MPILSYSKNIEPRETPDDFLLLQEQADSLRFLDVLHHFVIFCSGNTVLKVNQAASRLLGIPSNETVAGCNFFSFAHPDYAELRDVGLETFAEEKEAVAMKLLGRKGEIIDAEVWVSRAPQALSCFLVEVFNVTGHLRAAKTLRAREQRLQSIINTVADGIVTVDKQGIIQSGNPAAEGLFGYAQGEMLGMNLRSLVLLPDTELPPGDDKEWIRRLDSAPSAIGRKKDGATAHLEIAIREQSNAGVPSYTGIIRDISAKKEEEARIVFMAHHDALTGLPNRHLFSDRLDEALKRARRNRSKLALLFIDLDNFKPINDTYGHEAGDEVLKQAAERLSTTLRECDTVSRIGGDEFMVLLESLPSRNEACFVREKLLASLRRPILWRNAGIAVGASIGLSLFPDDGADINALTRFADLAMYKEKRTKKDDR